MHPKVAQGYHLPIWCEFEQRRVSLGTYKLFKESSEVGLAASLPSFLKWLQEMVDGYNGREEYENLCELQDLSIPPMFMAKSYRSIATYGNHFRATTWFGYNTMVTYDHRVMGQFEHTPLATKDNPDPMVELVVYVKECQEIL